MASPSSSNENKSGWKSFVDAADEFTNDTRKLYKFIKRRVSSKKKKRETEVKAIHIVPDSEEELKWACRSATSARSCTSTGTGSSVESRDEDGIETVHDMADEYNVFHGC
ncbi:hypothetical protein SNE40_023056 [Patella caerulea]|uniref:Uncharacterized protein n=1 Tax=Patella caerulea TaxID=87958 RepID=A0AAN8IVP3_PATCE